MRVRALQKRDRRTGQVVGIRWRFEKYNKEKQRYEPVPVDQIPKHLRESQNKEEVEAYCKSQSAIEHAIKHRAEQLRKWKEEYHDFETYLEKFAVYQCEKAPNSWENDVFYLEHYAFGFFLTKSSLNNLNIWHFSFDDFKAWLREVKPLKAKKKGLALNTQVKIIKALNRFLQFCYSKGFIENLHKCQSYRREDTINVTANDLFTADEIPKIFAELRKLRPISESFFRFLVGTGMRQNEAFGIGYRWVFQGEISGPKSQRIHQALKKHSLDNYHGYIVLESQPAYKMIRLTEPITDRHGKTWPTNSIPRKPLKHRKKIDPQYFRYVPIFDDALWNDLVERVEIVDELWKRRVYGDDLNNYTLFDGLTASMFYQDLSKVFRILKLRHRSPHKARHTYLTWLYEVTGEDMFLAEKIAGHRERRDVERYGHLSEIIGIEQKAKQLSKTGLSKV